MNIALANIEPRILDSIMVRELERENRSVSFRLTIADRPGPLGQFATTIRQLGANILEGLSPAQQVVKGFASESTRTLLVALEIGHDIRDIHRRRLRMTRCR